MARFPALAVIAAAALNTLALPARAYPLSLQATYFIYGAAPSDPDFDKDAWSSRSWAASTAFLRHRW